MEEQGWYVTVIAGVVTLFTGVFGKSFWDNRMAGKKIQSETDVEKIQLRQRVKQLEFALSILVSGFEDVYKDNPTMAEVVRKVKMTLEEKGSV